MIALVAGTWRAELRPEIGGCLSALSRDGVPVFRSMPDIASDALASACFPLVPYCNRIAGGRFSHGARDVALTPNVASQRHPLHGSGWKRSWRVIRHGRSSALLEDDCPAGEWPWAYCAHQHVALDETGCTIRLIVENRSSEPAPMGLGLHPYFRRSEDSIVRFEAQAMLGIDEEFLPDGTIQEPDALGPWSLGATPGDRLVDNCFTGWRGSATISDRHGSIRIRGFGTPYCHLFAPPDGRELCIEPVSHTPDALNRSPGEMTVLPPGAAAGIAIRVEASAPS